jgi:hypothetical protein
MRHDAMHGLKLERIVEDADPELIKIAQLIEAGEYEPARAKLTPWLNRRRLGRMAATKKSHVRLLDGVLALRTGDPSALRKLRKCVARDDPNVEAYGRGATEVLKKYQTEFEGQPLSDPEVFRQAGRALSSEYIERALATLEDRRFIRRKSCEYHTYMNRIRQHEKDMEAAAVFAGPAADDVLIELWKFGLELGEREYWQLRSEFERKYGGRRRVNWAEAEDYKLLVRNLNRVVEQWLDHVRKLSSYGFYQSKQGQLEKITEDD